MPMDSAPPPDLADPSSQALAAALPAIRAARTKGWGFVALAVILAVLAAFWAISALDEPFQWIIGIVIFGVFGVIGSVGWVQGKHERAVMPIIAQAFNLTYEKSPTRFYESLPANFIPLGGRRSVDDMMSGRVGDRHFRFAECRTETGGKNSSTLFRGIVLDVQSASTLPSFMIASEKETRGFLFFKGRVQVDGMELVKQATGHDGQTYGLWTLSS